LKYQTAIQFHLHAQPSEMATWSVEQMDAAVAAVDEITAAAEKASAAARR